jgi:hypothetical protein
MQLVGGSYRLKQQTTSTPKGLTDPQPVSFSFAGGEGDLNLPLSPPNIEDGRSSYRRTAPETALIREATDVRHESKWSWRGIRLPFSISHAIAAKPGVPSEAPCALLNQT